LGWLWHTDGTGYKMAKIALPSIGVKNTQIVAKFNGDILQRVNAGIANTAHDQSTTSSDGTTLFLSVSDTDSGWGETYTPTADEIKAYFYGWKMYHYESLNQNSTFDGTGTKAWIPILDPDKTRITTTLPTTEAPTIAEGKVEYYTLTYQLAIPQEEPITVEGALSLIDGGNQVEVSEGVIFREKANPQKNATDNYYAINALSHPSYSNDGKLKNKTNEILFVFKNGQVDPKWMFAKDYQFTFGGSWAYIKSSDYEPTAEYTVNYIAIDKHSFTTNTTEVIATYDTNMKTVQDKLVNKASDLETKVSIHANTLVDIIARLEAGGI
jgi:hypothetical protein